MWNPGLGPIFSTVWVSLQWQTHVDATVVTEHHLWWQGEMKLWLHPQLKALNLQNHIRFKRHKCFGERGRVFFWVIFLLCPYSSTSIWLQPGYCQVFQTTIFNSLSPATLWLPWPATIMGLQGKAIVGTLGLSALWRTGLSPGCHSSHQPEPRESTICCKLIAARWHLAGWERAPAWQGTATHRIKGKKGTGRGEGKR